MPGLVDLPCSWGILPIGDVTVRTATGTAYSLIQSVIDEISLMTGPLYSRPLSVVYGRSTDHADFVLNFCRHDA